MMANGLGLAQGLADTPGGHVVNGAFNERLHQREPREAEKTEGMTSALGNKKSCGRTSLPFLDRGGVGLRGSLKLRLLNWFENGSELTLEHVRC